MKALLTRVPWNALIISTLSLWLGSAYANGGIVTDGTLGRPSTVFSPGIGGPEQVVIPQSAGQTTGHNLFQSFSNFNISKGQTVTFAEDQKGFVDNVIARVTGKETSSINGTLRVTPEGRANFYLLNPNGVLFGNGVQIDVPGDFHVTTAHFIKFQDGAKYSADPVHSKLSAANPSAFGFTGSSKSNNVLIEVKDGAQLSNPQYGPSANTLDLVGQNIKVDNGGQVSANDVRLVAAKGTGSVTLDRDSYGYLKLPTSMPTVATAGKVVIDGQDTVIASSSDYGGRIAIWGGNVGISNGGSLKSVQIGNNTPQNSNGITVKALSFQMTNYGSLSSAVISGHNQPANVSIFTDGPLSVSSGSQILATNGNISSEGYGQVNIESGGEVALKGNSLASPVRGMIAGGNIDIKSHGNINITDNFIVDGNASYMGHLGLTSERAILMSGGAEVSFKTIGTDSTSTGISAINISAKYFSMKGRNTNLLSIASSDPVINIFTLDGVSLTDGSLISSTSALRGNGTINLFTRGGLIIQGNSGLDTFDDSFYFPTKEFIGGNVRIVSEYIYLDNGYIQSATRGRGGNIDITGVQSILAAGNNINGYQYPSYFGHPKVEGRIQKYLGGDDLKGKNVITVDNNGEGGNIAISGSLLNLNGAIINLPPTDFTPNNIQNLCDVSSKGNLGLSGRGGSKASAFDKAIFGY